MLFRRFLLTVTIAASVTKVILDEKAIRASDSSEENVLYEKFVDDSKLGSKFGSLGSSELDTSNASLLEPLTSNKITAQESLWTNSTEIPGWLKEYVGKHRRARQRLAEDSDSWKDYKYLVVRCLHRHKKCSGLSDRLKTIPVYLLLASQADRLLFIYWEKPAALEEFLLPPLGGLDWRLPSWLEQKIQSNNQTNFFLREENVHQWPQLSEPVICMKSLHGRKYYDDNRAPGEASFDRVLQAVWSMLFQPTPPIAELIEKHMAELHLKPGAYMAAHVRAQYVVNTIANHEEENAIRCAAQAGSRVPIYFASDSKATIRHALEYGRLQGQNVIARLSHKDPLHLDRGRHFLKQRRAQDWKNHPATDFYDIFVDLYLLANSQCVVHGAGGYGHLGNLLSHEKCGTNHRTHDCNWTTEVSFQN